MSFPPNPSTGGGGGSFVINDDHFFADNTARDAYFVLHPDELETGTLIYVDPGYQQYNGSSWVDVTAIVTGPPGEPGGDASGTVVNTTSFDGNLSDADDTVQKALETLDELSSSGGVTDHGALTGLSDDDHTQYIKHSLATALNDMLMASGAGTFVNKTISEVKTALGLGAAAYLEVGTTAGTVAAGDDSRFGSGSGITWNEVTGTSQSAAVDNGCITNNASLVTVTLPSTCAVGKIIRVAGKGAGMWKIAQNASQTIYFGDQNTTTGTAGYLAAQNRYDAVELLCITADTAFLVIASVGNLTVV